MFIKTNDNQLCNKEPFAFYGNGAYYNTMKAALKDGCETVIPLFESPVDEWTPPISLEKAKGIISYWSEKGHGASCSGLTECALARKVIQYYEG